MKLPIASIIIGPRQRLELGDLSDLDSMANPNVGLIQRIGVNDRNVLLWGRRRLAKAVQLGWTEIDVEIKPGLTPEQEQLIEWSEDFDRKNRTWQENCLALANLHHMMHMRDGYGTWTVRKLEEFTGISKSLVSIMLIVADALTKERDDHLAGKPSVWDAAVYTEAYKTLVLRHEAEINTEIERRRSLANPVKVAGTTEEPASAGSLVQSLDNTEVEIPVTKTVVRLRGRNYAYTDTPGSELAELTSVVIGYCSPRYQSTIAKLDLRKNGYIVLWRDLFDDFNKTREEFMANGFHAMPFPLVWNKVQPINNIGWPFAANCAYGLVASKTEQFLHAEPQSSCVSCVPDGENLPVSVIDLSINGISSTNYAITCISGVDPLNIIELGRVPIWHEPDKEKFDLTNARLKTYYEEQLPNVEVIT